jgi:esterase
MNLTPAGDALALRLDLPALRQMLMDYWRLDLWPLVEDAGLPGTLEVVLAERSTTVTMEERARLQRSGDHVHVHLVPDAGHWLHIDAPAAVVALLARTLPEDA